MKKLRTILCAALVGATALCSTVSLAACGGGNWSTDYIVIPVMNATRQRDQDLVETEVSKYVKEKLGFGVKFKFVDIYAQAGSTFYADMLNSGEQLDIFNIAFSNPDYYIKTKGVREIGSFINEKTTPWLYEYMQDPTSEKIVSYGTDGKAYGVSPIAGTAYYGSCYMVRKDILETIGVYGEGENKWVDGDYIDYDGLDLIFAKMKEYDPKCFPTGILGDNDYSHSFIAADPVCSEILTPQGVLMLEEKDNGGKPTEIVNYYETDAYKEYVEHAAEWNAKGYINGDALQTSSTVKDFLKSEKFYGYFSDPNPQYAMDNKKLYGHEFVRLMTVKPHWYMGAPAMGMYISAKSKNAEKCMRFLDLTFSDTYLGSMLSSGVEGRQWEFVVDEAAGITKEDFLVQVPEGVSFDNRGYWSMGYGNYVKQAYYKSADETAAEGQKIRETINASNGVLTKEATKLSSPAVGFVWDQGKLNTANVTVAMKKYVYLLSTGKGKKGSDDTYTGPGSTYAEFIEELGQKNLKVIMKSKQDQLNEWLTAKN